MLVRLQPGTSGDAAKLPKNPGTQKLTPPWSADAGVGAASADAANPAAAMRVVSRPLRPAMDAPIHTDAESPKLSQLPEPYEMTFPQQVCGLAPYLTSIRPDIIQDRDLPQQNLADDMGGLH